jgi:hypothetical protein
MFIWSLRFLELANDRLHVSQVSREDGGRGDMLSSSVRTLGDTGSWLSPPADLGGARDEVAAEHRDLWAFLDSRLQKENKLFLGTHQLYGQPDNPALFI